MTTGHPDLASLVQQMDTLRPVYFPLAPHVAASLDAHVRQVYGTLLCSVAVGKGFLSNRSAIVLELILDALDLRSQLGTLLERARVLDITGIQEFVHLASHHKLGNAFLVDALILSCVDGPIGPAQQALLAELADFLQVTETQMSRIIFWAGQIMGCSGSQPLLETIKLENPNPPAGRATLLSPWTMETDLSTRKFHFDKIPSAGMPIRANQKVAATKKRTIDGMEVVLVARSPVDGVLVEFLVGVDEKVKVDQEVARVAPIPDYCAAWVPVLLVDYNSQAANEGTE